MEPVAANPLFGVFSGNRKCLRHGGDTCVKCCVKTGNLGNVGTPLRDEADGGKVVRLMQRRQRIEFLQVIKD